MAASFKVHYKDELSRNFKFLIKEGRIFKTAGGRMSAGGRWRGRSPESRGFCVKKEMYLTEKDRRGQRKRVNFILIEQSPVPTY